MKGIRTGRKQALSGGETGECRRTRVKERSALPRTTKSSEDDEAKIPLHKPTFVLLRGRGSQLLGFRRDEKDGAVFCEYAKPRARRGEREIFRSTEWEILVTESLFPSFYTKRL